MSAFWNFVNKLVPGTLAKAEDVNTNLSGIDTGLNLIEAEIDKTIQITNAPGVVDIGLNAAARANKLISFDVNGDIAATTIIGDWKGDHANAAGTNYQIRDVVKDAAAALRQDSLYICTNTHTSTGSLAVDTANWDLLVDSAESIEWAIKTDGIIDATDYSSKAYAIGGTGVSSTAGKGAAKEWATRTNALVDTVEASAKAWSIGGTGTTNTAGRGAAKEWATKAEDSLVDTAEYSAKHYAAKAAASYDSFDDRYLGAKASDPTLDNDGQALLAGAIYWNTTTTKMKVYTGAVWADLSVGVGIADNADATAITIDASENVGIGVTPDAWGTGYSVLRLGGLSSLMGNTSKAAGSSSHLSTNGYRDATNWKYIVTDEAARYLQNAGAHIFYVAPSGTADTAITWTTALTLDNSGNAIFGGTLSTTGAITEAGTSLASKYLGISAKAADSEKLDNLDSTQFLRSDTEDSYTPNFLNLSHSTASITFDSQTAPDGRGTRRITCNDGGGNWSFRSGSYFSGSDKYTVTGDGATNIIHGTDGVDGNVTIKVASTGTAGTAITWAKQFVVSTTNVTIDGNTVWHAGNTHNHSAAEITSGTLAVVRGGTGVTTSTGTGSNVLSSSPALTGNPTVPTQAVADDSTRAASTAHVKDASLGWGQTWTDVSASRSFGTTYTNTTGKPIFVYVSAASGSGNSATLYVSINSGTAIAFGADVPGGATTNVSPTGAFIVPAGATYNVTTTLGNKANWSELR